MSLRIFDIDEEKIREGNNPEPNSLISSAKKQWNHLKSFQRNIQNQIEKELKLGSTNKTIYTED